ncbi:MAG: UDP-glucose 4-epimerase, partial [Glaciecola sp.]
MRYLVTGSGVLGSSLAERLRTGGHDVVVIDITPPATAADRQVDLRIRSQLDPILEGVDGVFHTAALHGFRDNPPIEFCEVNLQGTWNLLDAMHEAGVTRLVHSSTVGVIGKPDERPRAIDHTTPTNARHDTYDTTKRLGEELIQLLAPKFGIEWVCLRYGGFEDYIRQVFDGLPYVWASSGALVCLDDVVTANLQAMTGLPLPSRGYLVI